MTPWCAVARAAQARDPDTSQALSNARRDSSMGSPTATGGGTRARLDRWGNSVFSRSHTGHGTGTWRARLVLVVDSTMPLPVTYVADARTVSSRSPTCCAAVRQPHRSAVRSSREPGSASRNARSPWRAESARHGKYRRSRSTGWQIFGPLDFRRHVSSNLSGPLRVLKHCSDELMSLRDAASRERGAAL